MYILEEEIPKNAIFASLLVPYIPNSMHIVTKIGFLCLLLGLVGDVYKEAISKSELIWSIFIIDVCMPTSSFYTRFHEDFISKYEPIWLNFVTDVYIPTFFLRVSFLLKYD